ncbi:MAG TPA: hemerythrin domain-containing protein [Polyangiales bacterium]|nr:hemerythrin domain-containing protein [Polyangiales bacterium]
MPGAYEMFPLGLRLSHLALLRNLDQFARLSRGQGGLVANRPDGSQTLSQERAAEYVVWYDDFLGVHHRGEDEHLFPALRKHSAGRTTDVAHLDAWTHEHQAIYRLGREMRAAGQRMADGAASALDEVQRLAAELRQLLIPHLKAEEEALTPANLRDMIPEPELARAQLAIPRSQGIGAIRMAQFFVHSLEPAEQRALLGDTPWFFRKLVLGALGARRARRFGALMPVREVYL